MPSFSERMGLTNSVRPLQLNGIDKPLLNSLWNIYNLLVMKGIEPTHYDQNEQDNYTRLVWLHIFKDIEPLDQAPYRYDFLVSKIRSYFFSTEWYKVYNLIEFALKTPSSFNVDNYIKLINNVLETEYSGYRFINKVIAPISNAIETDSINEAINVTNYTFDGHANIHLKNALKSISDKPNPDYRNSVKEAISAVGTVVRKIAGKSTFGDGLKYLEQTGLKVNSQFKEGLNKFYNYTNDPSTGIRHEIIDAPNPPDFETAKFMLLACSAFINYIIPIAQKAGIDIKNNI